MCILQPDMCAICAFLFNTLKLCLRQLLILCRAGTRYETPDNLGAANLLRSCAGLATKCHSKFAITRILEESGASLTAVSDRDSIIYTLECLQEHL